MESFNRILLSEEANKLRGIVYVWRAGKKIQRLNGESDVLYIGQTQNNFATRYASFHNFMFSRQNRLKFDYAINKLGGIQVCVLDYERLSTTLMGAEGQLLWWYFQNHFEYPPFNYSRTKCRNDEIYF